MRSNTPYKRFSLFDYHTSMAAENILISYKGPFTDTVLAEISQTLKLILQPHPQLSKKLFSVFIELAQNISYYSSERNYIEGKEGSPGIGTIVIKEHPDHFTLITGNVIKNDDTQKLAAKCATINSLDREELREYKRMQRNQPNNEKKDGGNIGLIQVALTASSPLDVELTPINELYSFFALSVDLDKFTSSPKQ